MPVIFPFRGGFLKDLIAALWAENVVSVAEVLM
jgi:hypothetical protein